MKWHRTPQQQAQQAPVDPNEAFRAFVLSDDQRRAYKRRTWSVVIPPFSPGPTTGAGDLAAATQGTPADALPRLEGGFPANMQGPTPVSGGYALTWTPTAEETSPAGTPYAFSVRYVDQRTGVVRDESGIKGFNLTGYSELERTAVIRAEDEDIEAVGDEYVVFLNVAWLDPDNLPAYREHMQLEPLLYGTLSFRLAQQSRPRLEQVFAFEPGDVRIVDLRGARRETGLPELFKMEVLYVDYDIDNERDRIGTKTLWFIGAEDQAHTKITRIPIEVPSANYLPAAAASFNGELIVDLNSNLWAVPPDGGEAEYRAAIFGNVDAMVAFTGTDGNEYLIAHTERPQGRNERLTWYRRGFGDGQAGRNPGLWSQQRWNADLPGVGIRKPRGMANDGTTIWAIDDVNLWKVAIADIGATTIQTWAVTDGRIGTTASNAPNGFTATTIGTAPPWQERLTLTAFDEVITTNWVGLRVPLAAKSNLAAWRLHESRLGTNYPATSWTHVVDDAAYAYYTVQPVLRGLDSYAVEELASSPGPVAYPADITPALVGAHGIDDPTALLFKQGELLAEAGSEIYVVNTVAGRRVGGAIDEFEVVVRGLTELDDRTYGYGSEGLVKIAAFDVDALPDAPTGLALSNVVQEL